MIKILYFSIQKTSKMLLFKPQYLFICNTSDTRHQSLTVD